MSATDYLIEVEKLSISFKTDDQKVTACENISFSIKKGEILGIVGQSGSGKTMTGMAISGLLPKSAKIECINIAFENKILVDENRLYQNEVFRNLRGKQIGFIFQEPMSSLNPVLTCGIQLKEILDSKSENQKHNRSKELLSAVNLPDSVLEKYPHQLSGGQLQRVMIALAIAQNPKLLIADEPTTALDATIRKEILDLLIELKMKLNFSVLFISHDLGAVSYISDRVLVMHKGKIIERGLSHQIINNPKELYTQTLVNHQFKNFKTKVKEKSKNTSILEVENLTISYENKRWLSFKKNSSSLAVDDVSFLVNEGEILGIVGESGSGKSSIGKAIVKLVQPYKGSIYLTSSKATQLFDNQSIRPGRLIQMIFQNPMNSLNPRQPIGLGLMEIFNYLKYPNPRANSIDMLEKVGLSSSDFFKYPHEFSGGEKQRVCIAKALAMQPKILVCDECVSAIDLKIQSQILELLKQIQQDLNLTLIFISHDLGVVRAISDRILVMKDGKIVQKGNTEEIFLHPKTDYVKELIEAIL